MKQRFTDNVVPESSKRARRRIADETRSVRLEQNLTQEALAQRCGTQKSNISRLESGRYNPSLDFMVKLADAMGKELVMGFNDENKN